MLKQRKVAHSGLSAFLTEGEPGEHLLTAPIIPEEVKHPRVLSWVRTLKNTMVV